MFDAGDLEHLFDRVEKSVVTAVDDLLEPGVDDQFGAREARRDGDVDRSARDGTAVERRLTDGVLLGVGAQTFIEVGSAFGRPVAARTAAVEAVFDASGSTVVTGRENMVVLHDHRPDIAAAAIGTFRHYRGDFHKIFIPARTWIFSCFHH